MTTSDLLLDALYRSARDEQAAALAARCAPVLYFDANEPFLPLAAGYTIFSQDGPSPSFERAIELRPEEKAPAAMAIEYAIWWDWDIHHLYELEHAWVYLDENSVPVRIEASWHGTFYDLPLSLEGGHPVLLSEPGKHAFATHPSWFERRQRKFRRTETVSVGAHAHVLINSMFSGKIRRRVFDSVLVRTFLMRSAFDPAWRFTKRYAFPEHTFVPWQELADWIPERVNSVMEGLERTTTPQDYAAMRVVSAPGTAAGLEMAARTGAEAVQAPLRFLENRLVLGEEPDALDMDEAFRFLYSEPMAAFLEVQDAAAVDALAWFVRSKDVAGSVIVLSDDPGLLARYNAYVPGGVTAIRLKAPDEDAMRLAKESGAAFVNPPWEGAPPQPEWIETIHNAGLGVIVGPVESAETLEELQRMGVDVLWQARKE